MSSLNKLNWFEPSVIVLISMDDKLISVILSVTWRVDKQCTGEHYTNTNNTRVC